MAFLGGFFGGGTPPAYQTPQNIKDFMQPIPVSEMQTASLAQNLLGAKQGYDTANKNIVGLNEKLALPNLTDEQKQGINENIQSWTRERDKAAQYADSLRNTAATIGVDVSDYGSDKSLQESNQAFQNHKQMAFKNFLNLPTLGELEENRYLELRSQGASPGMANRILNRERDGMKQQLARRLNDFMGTYGKNPDGSIDQDVGIAAIGSVLQDPQQVAQLFVSGFAMPQKVYDTNQNLATHLAVANANNLAAWDRAKLSSDTNILTSRENQAGQNERLAATLKARQEENERQLLFQDKWNMINTEIKANSGKGGSNMAQEITELANLWGYNEKGLTDEQRAEIWNKAAKAWTMQKYPNIYKADTNELLEKMGKLYETGRARGLKGAELVEYVDREMGFTSPNDKEQNELLNLFGNEFKNIAGAINNKNPEKAQEYIGVIATKLDDDTYKKALPPESYELAKNVLSLYTDIVNGKYPTDKEADALFKAEFLYKNGYEPTNDDYLAWRKNARDFGDKQKKPVTTPAWKFDVIPPQAGVANVHPSWNNNAYGLNPYSGYGQAWFPQNNR